MNAFQFLEGTIKSAALIAQSMSRSRFQFLEGTIKSFFALDVENAKIDFNS